MASAAYDYPELARISQGLGVEIIEDAEDQADRALAELNRLRDLVDRDFMLERAATACDNVMRQAAADGGVSVSWFAWVPDHLRQVAARIAAVTHPRPTSYGEASPSDEGQVTP